MGTYLMGAGAILALLAALLHSGFALGNDKQFLFRSCFEIPLRRQNYEKTILVNRVDDPDGGVLGSLQFSNARANRNPGSHCTPGEIACIQPLHWRAIHWINLPTSPLMNGGGDWLLTEWCS